MKNVEEVMVELIALTYDSKKQSLEGPVESYTIYRVEELDSELDFLCANKKDYKALKDIVRDSYSKMEQEMKRNSSLVRAAQETWAYFQVTSC